MTCQEELLQCHDPPRIPDIVAAVKTKRPYIQRLQNGKIVDFDK
jgi:hypothetical protein